MEYQELIEIANLVTDEVAAIIHWQMVLAGIHEELNRNAFHPFEQDIIYSEHFGQMPSKPRKLVINGVTVTSRILHQTGLRLSDIRGADLLYEIEDEKYILIQFKKADDKTGSVKNDSAQLDVLLANCPSVCIYKRNPPRRIPARLNGFCGCWYRVDDLKGTHILHACEAKVIFNDSRKSAPSLEFASGISKETFLNLFAACRIGALTRIHKPELYVSELLEHRHIIFETLQSGRWQR